MTPIAAPPHVFSLDAERLAYGRFRVKAGTYAFETYNSVDLPGEAFLPGLLGGPLRDEAGFGELLKGLISRVEVPIAEASLVLPDAWLRLAFTEVGELPADPQDLDAVLRWKLKRLVPFRVDELRLRGTEVSPLANQEEPNRALLGFALETLLAQQERLFQEAGIRLGRIANLSLSLLASLSTEVVDRPLLGLVVVEPAGYTLLFSRRGEPILHRFKSADPELPYELRQQRAIHDLRLTRSFLAERFPGTTLDLNLLVKSPAVEDPWQEWVENGLESRTEALSEAHLPALSVQISKQEADSAESFLEIAPMLGASRQEVA
ncbi:MAG: hypothetical protein K0U98_09780 [Deltaproteobacteria bacterium]|nr:hypothetical protein [Deltaproteobacteria bacterium]